MERILSILKSLIHLEIQNVIVTLFLIGIVGVLFTGKITTIIPFIALIVILFLIKKLLSRN